MSWRLAFRDFGFAYHCRSHGRRTLFGPTLRKNVEPLFQNSRPDCHTFYDAFYCPSQFRRLSKLITKIGPIIDPDIQEESYTPSHIRISSVIKYLPVLVRPRSRNRRRNNIQDVSCTSFSLALHATCHLLAISMPYGSALTIVFFSGGLLCSR